MSSSIDEEEIEVRGLLNRHRDRIVLDLESSNMLTVLVKKNVISVITEALLINYRPVPEDQKRKCDLLIDTIAKCGFKKFKEFCYAIETECPDLINEMINDHSPIHDGVPMNVGDAAAAAKNDAALADEITIVPEHGSSVTGDESSPDVQHAVDGTPIYPALLAAATVSTRAAAADNAPLAAAEDDNDNGGGLYETVDRSHRSTSYCDPPRPMIPPVPKQRTSMLAQPALVTSSQPPPNVAEMVNKFNQTLFIKSSSVISTTSTSSHSSSTTTGCLESGAAAAIEPPTTPQMLPSSSRPSTLSSSSKDSSLYCQTMPLPPKTKSQNSGLAKLEKIYQQISGGTLRRNKSQKKERPDNLPMAPTGEHPPEGSPDTQSAPSAAAVVKKREKGLLKYRHSCSNQDEAIYVAAKKFGGKKRKERNRRQYHSMNETIEVLADQVVEDDPMGERSSWEYHTITVTRVSGYGFGIAVSGGRDNPHFANGDPSIAVSDVLKGGPAEEKLQVNDRIISVNGVSLENVEYATAVQVLRDSGNTVSLVVKRRVMNLNFLNSPGQSNSLSTSAHQHQHSISSNGLAGSGGTNASNALSGTNANNQQSIKISIAKTNKKDDFGIVLGCRLFVKEISSKVKEQLTANGYNLQEGDIVTRIHNTNCGDGMSLKEAKKIIDSCKDRLNMVVARDLLSSSPTVPGTPSYSHTAQVSNCSNIDESFLPGGASYSSQNLYVQPPTRPSTMLDDKSNLTPRGRSRNPLLDASSLSQLDRPQTPPSNGHSRSRSGADEPPNRPPMPREEFYSSRRNLYDDDPLQRAKQSAEPRFITFQKEGSVGIRLTGGNEAGIFVTAVQPGSPASLQGLTPGDKILKVNDMDMQGVTREEAVLYLLSLQDRIDLIVQHSREEYDNVVASQRGDSFHIKTHFHCEQPLKGEMSFRAGDVFRVTDTLHNGVVGSWQVQKIGRNHQEMQKGVIPNKSRAEELATAQFNASKKEMNASESRGSFFRRKRSAHRRSKSLNRENWDDVVFSDAISKFPAYERVVLRHPGFVRPVCLFGPTADVARERLMKDFPDKFTAPYQDDTDKGSSKCGIVRLSNIRDIMDRGKHALLDITPNAVDRLNYAQFYPIVIFCKADNKMIIKRLRQGVPKSQHKSSKKLLEQCQKLEKIWSHVFSVQIPLNDTETWYRQVREVIDQQQSGAVWMSATKPVESLSDDFLFPMNTSRLSYASSPESDLELSPGPSTSLSLGNLPQLVKSSSDPSIATNQDILDRDRELGDAMPPPYTNHYDSGSNRRSGIPPDSKFPYSSTNGGDLASMGLSQVPQSGQRTIYGVPPDLPPRIDRASKPSGLVIPTSPIRNGSAAKNSSIHSIATLGRSSQDRLFSPSKMNGDGGADQDEYASRNQLMANKRLNGNSLERNQVSLDRQSRPTSNTKMGNESYDSVSSYDSYNTGANMRLGPNTPDDDLKSAPIAAARPGPTDYMINSPSKGMGHHAHPSMDYSRPPGGGGGGHHPELSRSLSSGPNDLNRANYGNGIPTMDPHMTRGIIPQRPTNLGLEPSPRKMLPFEAKTDYGKYSRNSSASQADYSKGMPKSPQIGPPPTTPGGSNGGGVVNGGMPFKPVPPPKPKNYRPPMQNGMGDHHQAPPHWENGMDPSPRSPINNGYGGGGNGVGGGGYYPNPPMGMSYHSQNPMGMPGHGPPYPGYPPGGNNNGAPPMPAMMNGNGHYSSGGNGPHASAQLGYNNNTNGNHINNTNYNGQPVYNGGQFMHRGFGNLPAIPNSSIDLAGSREQRGSAFELYRKPQIGAGGHQHGHSAYDPASNSYYQGGTPQYHHNYPPNQGGYYPNDRPYAHHHGGDPSGAPPPLPPPIKPKKKLLKAPLAALKNAFLKTTKPLRRQSSLAEADKKLKPTMSLRRQHSMMEQRNQYPNLTNDPRYQHYQQLPNRPPIPVNGFPGYPPNNRPQMHGGYSGYPGHPDPLNSTYQNFQTENPYQRAGSYTNHYNDEEESLYANRALIDLQQNHRHPPQQRGIVRRHSLADRPASAMHFRRNQGDGQSERRSNHSNDPMEEPIYQSQGGSYMLKDMPYDGDRLSRPNYMQRPERCRSTDPTYQSRKDMHRDHLYQSRQEMQQRIHQSRQEMERGTSETPSDSSSTPSGTPTHPIRDAIYVTRKELKESGFKTRTQLRDHLYQTRREAMETMAEPLYVSKKSMQHDPIYETNREHEVSQEVLNADAVVVIESVPSADGSRSDHSNHSDLEEKLKGINIEPEHGSSDGTQPFSKSRDADDSQDTVIHVHSGTPPPTSPQRRTTIEVGLSNSSNGTIEDASAITVIAANATMSPVPANRSTHLSNMIKRTAPHPLIPPPPPLEDEFLIIPPTATTAQEVDPSLLSLECRRKMMASRTSIETQYTSQASLPSTIGPPNASSTPYASDLSIAIAQAGAPGTVAPREPTTTRGEFDENGGVLSDPIWNVSLEIPKGALPAGRMQEIYFTVTDPRLSECVGGPPLDMENGETMLSPLVMCGPQGLEFLVPVTLNIPHCAGQTTSLGIALKATDSESNLKTNWDNIDLPSNAAAHTVSVKVDHF